MSSLLTLPRNPKSARPPRQRRVARRNSLFRTRERRLTATNHKNQDALRYVRRHRVESVAPMVFLEAALRENCAQTYATVYRFCYELVPFVSPPPVPPSALLRAPADDVSGSLDSLRGAPRVWSAGITTPLRSTVVGC